MKNSFDVLVLPAGLPDMEAVAAEIAPASTGLSAWEVARAAKLTYEYETIYRGFGIAGAHTLLRSLDDYSDEQPDGSLNLAFGPSAERAEWLLGLVATCLTCGSTVTAKLNETTMQLLSLAREICKRILWH